MVLWLSVIGLFATLGESTVRLGKPKNETGNQSFFSRLDNLRQDVRPHPEAYRVSGSARL